MSQHIAGAHSRTSLKSRLKFHLKEVEGKREETLDSKKDEIVYLVPFLDLH